MYNSWVDGKDVVVPEAAGYFHQLAEGLGRHFFQVVCGADGRPLAASPEEETPRVLRGCVYKAQAFFRVRIRRADFYIVTWAGTTGYVYHARPMVGPQRSVLDVRLHAAFDDSILRPPVAYDASFPYAAAKALLEKRGCVWCRKPHYVLPIESACPHSTIRRAACA